MRRLRALPLALLSALLIALAGCGGGSGGSGSTASGPDPASVAPPDAAIYGEALVRPSGDVADGVLAAARKVLLVQDPAGELRKLVDRALADKAGGGKQTYARDIEPWLGARLGGFLLLPTSAHADPDAAFVVTVRDRGALAQGLTRQRAEGDLHKAGSYRGIAYDAATSGGFRSAAIGDFLVVASSMRALEAAIDASKGASLAESERYRNAIEPLDSDQLAFVYAEPRALPQLLSRATPTSVPPRLLAMARKVAQGDPVTLGLTARADEIALELHADVGGTPLAGLKDGGLSVGELPSDAWLVLATPALGPLVRSVLDAAGVHDKATAQVRQSLGLDLDRDLLAPLGGLAVFARGTNVLDLGGGVVLKLRDAAAARTLLTRLRAIAGAATGGVVHSSSIEGFELQLPRVPQPIAVGALGDRVAAGYGRSSTEALLDPQKRFDESPAGKAAIATLGDGFTPSLVLLAPPLVDLLDSLDEIGVANISPALPYLRPYRSLAVGTKRDGDRMTVRVVAALR